MERETIQIPIGRWTFRKEKTLLTKLMLKFKIEMQKQVKVMKRLSLVLFALMSVSTYAQCDFKTFLNTYFEISNKTFRKRFTFVLKFGR